jgi:phenylalanyl-tRNA synthetase beta chain
MKISYEWLKSLIAFEDTPDKLAELLTNTGLEVEHVDEIESIPGALRGLVVGKVIECGKHENADKLRVTKVDIGGEHLLSIVCGAPNVAVGQKVIVAPINTTIYPSGQEPFTIKKAKIRGELSEGMICAEDEIGLGSGHDGILVLPSDIAIGTLAADHFQLQSDYCIEIGLTPNRGDAISHIGTARDVKAVTGLPIIHPSIDASSFTEKDALPVDLIATEKCLRYSAITMDGIAVGPSPEWMQRRLRTIGHKPMNNVVDVTNYVMHELGQPIHAFDLDKISGKIVVREAKKGEKLVCLDAIEREFLGDELLITDEKKTLAIAGVFGGLDSGVQPNTKRVLIESACFEAGTVRQTARRFGLNTDASFRFERGTDPNLTEIALRRVVELLKECANAHVSSQIADIYPSEIQGTTVDLDISWLNQFCGTNLSKQELVDILSGLDILVQEETGKTLKLKIPTYRIDVTRPVDVAEEVLRIYGYNKVVIPKRISMTPAIQPHFDSINLRNQVADYLSSAGFLEIMNNSQVPGDQAGEDAVQILNPLSNEYAVMRTDLKYGVLQSLAHNWKRKNENLKFYEFGKVYHQKDAKRREAEQLIIAGTGLVHESNWHPKSAKFDFYYLKSIVRNLLLFSGLKESHMKELCDFSEFNPSKLKNHDVHAEAPYVVIDWEGWIKKARKAKFTLAEIPKFPVVSKDISAVIDKKVQFASLEEIAKKCSGKYYRGINCFDVFEGEKIGLDKKAYAFTIYLVDEEKTMNEKQIENIFSSTIHQLETELNAIVRR